MKILPLKIFLVVFLSIMLTQCKSCSGPELCSHHVGNGEHLVTYQTPDGIQHLINKGMLTFLVMQ